MPGDFVELEARRLSHVPTIPLFFLETERTKKGKQGGGQEIVRREDMHN